MNINENSFRITVDMKVETYIIISIAASPIGRAVIMKVEIFMSVDPEHISWWDQMKNAKVTDTYNTIVNLFWDNHFSEQYRIEGVVHFERNI